MELDLGKRLKECRFQPLPNSATGAREPRRYGELMNLSLSGLATPQSGHDRLHVLLDFVTSSSDTVRQPQVTATTREQGLSVKSSLCSRPVLVGIDDDHWPFDPDSIQA